MNWKHSLQVGMLRAGLTLAAIAACMVLAPGLSAPVQAAALGTVVPIGGQASDLALDEGRGLLYIANFTANRIEVMSLSYNTVHPSMNVAPQPGSIPLSPDGNYLLVAHFGNYVAPGSPARCSADVEKNDRCEAPAPAQDCSRGVRTPERNKQSLLWLLRSPAHWSQSRTPISAPL